MPKHVWIIASVLSALVLLGFAGVTIWQNERDLKGARTQLDQSLARLETTTNELAQAKAQIDDLRRQQEAVTQAQKNLEREMRGALESKDITISQLQGKLTVNILDRILFDSGEAVLKSEGEAVLKQIATILSQYPERQIHVIGHTDNVPIRASARNKYSSNWELSTARATAAVRYLSEFGGVDPRRLGAVGYGEFHPIADNATAEGRAKNRRIALVVLSEELAGSDASPSARVIVPKIASTNVVTTNAAITHMAATNTAVTNIVPASNAPVSMATNAIVPAIPSPSAATNSTPAVTTNTSESAASGAKDGKP